MDRSVPPNMRVTADSRVSVLRTTLVFCFLPTSSQPSEGETGRAISEASSSVGREAEVDREDSVLDTILRSSSCRVSMNHPRNS